MKEKSILEQALLQINTIEEATQKNAKGILRSVMKEELNDLMQEEDENPDDEEEGVDTPADDEGIDDELPGEGEEEGDDTDDEEIDDEMPTDDELPGEEEEEDDDLDFGDEDVIDATEFPEDEVIKVFKAMKPEDGIIVKKDGNKLEVSDEDNQYIIKLDEQKGALKGLSIDGGKKSKKNVTEIDEEDETIYEIELDDEEDDTIYEIELDDNMQDTPIEATEQVKKGSPVGSKNYHDKESKPFNCTKKTNQELPEAARTIGNGVRPPAQKTKFKAGRYDMMNEQIKTLKKQNDEYKKALVMFKEKLNEVAVFNANLAYATRLFTEGTTTKTEKIEILKRFDTISTIKESKNLYEQIKTELGTKKPITEKVENKLNVTPKKSTSEILNEVKQYENPQFKRMKELMSKIK
jgi:hypothetical protein